jgi:hypothetical protein
MQECVMQECVQVLECLDPESRLDSAASLELALGNPHHPNDFHVVQHSTMPPCLAFIVCTCPHITQLHCQALPQFGLIPLYLSW